MIARLRVTSSVPALLLVVAACAAGAPTITEPVDTTRPTEPLYTRAPTDQPTATAARTAEATEDTGLSDGNQWPATASLVLSGTLGRRDGSFSDSGVARWCGGVYSMTLDPDAFVLDLWYDTGHEQVRLAKLSADDLAPGSSTSVFDIDVAGAITALSADASIVIHAGQTGMAEIGTGMAQLSVNGGTRTLVAHAVDEDGQTADLTAGCTDPGT